MAADSRSSLYPGPRRDPSLPPRLSSPRDEPSRLLSQHGSAHLRRPSAPSSGQPSQELGRGSLARKTYFDDNFGLQSRNSSSLEDPHLIYRQQSFPEDARESVPHSYSQPQQSGRQSMRQSFIQRPFFESGGTSFAKELSQDQIVSESGSFVPESTHQSVTQESGHMQTDQEFMSSSRSSSRSWPAAQSYPTSGDESSSFIGPNASYISVENEGGSLQNEDILYHHTPGSSRGVSQQEANLARPSQEIPRKSKVQQEYMYASAPRRSSQRNSGVILSQQANAADDLKGLQTQELMYSPSFQRESIGQPRQLDGLDMSSQSSGEQISEHSVNAAVHDYGEFEEEGYHLRNPEMQQPSIQECRGIVGAEGEAFMEQGYLLNENHESYDEQYDDGEGVHDAFEENIGGSEGSLDKRYTLSRKSRGKSIVQEFIYPSSRGSFQMDGLATDPEEKQEFHAESHDAPSSLRLFSRLSISDPTKDLTKQQTQELMYAPSFAKESTKQNFGQGTNIQNNQENPEGKESASERRQSFQQNLEEQECEEEIHLPVGVQLEANQQHDPNEDLGEDPERDPTLYMDNGHASFRHTSIYSKSPSLVNENLLSAYGGGLSNEEASYGSVPCLSAEEDSTNEDSIYSPGGSLETTVEMELDNGNIQFDSDDTRITEQASNYSILSKNLMDDEVHEDKHDGFAYLLPAESNVGDETFLDDSLLKKQDVKSQDFECKDKSNRDNEISDQPAGITQSRSFMNLETSGRRGSSSSKSFLKVPFGASELSYERFAKAHFAEPTVGVWPFFWKSVFMQDLLKFCKAPLTQPLLQRLTAPTHRKCAVYAFTHLLAYMGDFVTQQERSYHIQQILMLGVKYSELRDEIFCQICKQTTANPSRQSNSRGWQAMALCVGTFSPSSTLRPFLEAHLEQVSGNFIGEWAGSTSSYQDEGMSDPAKAAEYCLARFRKVAQMGGRHNAPLLVEINAVEKMETVRVNIYLPDDTFKVLNLDPMATAGEVTEQLVIMTGLSDPNYYGIFQVLYGDATIEKVLNKNAYIMEIISEWKKASLPPLEADSSLIMKAKRIFEKHVLCLPNAGILDGRRSNNEFPEAVPRRREMLFKRKIFIEDLTALSEDVQKNVENFGYVQTVRDVEYGVYPIEEHDAVMLGALQLRADSRFLGNLDHALTDEIIRKFGPKIYVEGNEMEWKAAVLRTAAALPHETDVSLCISDYIDFLRSRCVLYGCCWYYVQQNADPRLPHEMFVAINTAGVYFVEVKTKELLLHLQFMEICSWGYSTYLFSLVTGNMTYNHDHRLITMQGAEIGETLQMYINRLQY